MTVRLLSRSPDPRRAGLRRGHGHRDLPAPRLHQPLFDELCLSDPKLIRQIHTRLSRRRGRRADDQHLRRQSGGAGASSPWPRSCREIVRAGARLAREVADAADRPMLRGRLDRPAAQPAAVRGGDRGDDRRAGRGPDGGRGRLHPVRDAAEPRGAGALRGGHAAPAGRALRAFVRHRRAPARRPPASRSSGCWPRCRTARRSRSPGA